MTIVEIVNKLRNQHLRGLITDMEYALALNDAAKLAGQEAVNRYTVVIYCVHGDYTQKLEGLRFGDVKLYVNCSKCADSDDLCTCCEAKMQFLLIHHQVVQPSNLMEQVVTVFQEV
jgi:hypothetical protein